MGSNRIKLKFRQKVSLGLLAGALATLFLSATGALPESWVESLYARRVYPVVSSVMAFVAGSVGFSWIDILIPGSVLGVVYLAYRRKFLQLLGLVSAGYLFFFWAWGLNYDREPMAAKLDFNAERVNAESVAALAAETARALNTLYSERLVADWGEDPLFQEAFRRVGEVVAELDGSTWAGRRSRVKSSRILNPFFRAAGVDGMFNPFGHEPLVTDGLLDFERPMVVLHELAHVMGYPNEGDANFVALMAAVNSTDPALQYSGWLTLWLYLRSPERDELLEAGPRSDLEAIYARVARNRVDWLSRAQTRSLDAFLKIHNVQEGVRSYSEIVRLAAGTRPYWDRFSE